MHIRQVGYCVAGLSVLALASAPGGVASAADKKPRVAKVGKTVSDGPAKAAPQADGPGESGTALAPGPEASASAPAATAAAPADGGAAEGGAFTFEVMHPMLKTISGQRTAIATGKLPVIEIDKSGAFSLQAGRLDLRNEDAKAYLTAWVTMRGRVDEKTGRVLGMKMDANCNAGRIGGPCEVYQLFADPNMEVGTTKAGAGSAATFVLKGRFVGPIGHTMTIFEDGGRMEGRKREDGRIEGQFETQIRGKMLVKLFPPKPKGPKPAPAWALPACIVLGVVTLGAAVGARVRRAREVRRKASAAAGEPIAGGGELVGGVNGDGAGGTAAAVVPGWPTRPGARKRRRRRRAAWNLG